MALTDSWLKANHGKERAAMVTRSDRDGLGVRVSPKGKITFQVRYRLNGRQSRMDLGAYPLMSLKKARDDAQEVRALVQEGTDPKLARDLERTKRAAASSIESLFREWYASYCEKRKSNPHLIMRSFEIHLFPEIGHLPAGQAETHHWMDVLEKVAGFKPGIAERLLVNGKQMYRWAQRRQLVESNPLERITAKHDLHLSKRVIDRVLSDSEIALIWEALEHSRMTAKNAVFLKLCLAFGCRSGELRLSNIGDWDLENGIWTVPPENHKTGKVTGKPLLRPIIEPVKPLVEEAIRLSSSRSRKGPLFNNRDSAERMGRSSVLPLPYNIMQWARRHRKVEMEHWSVHDLRRTMRTNMSDLAPPHIAETMLGHVMPGQWRVYDHYDYLPEQTEAYAAWWKRLQRIVHAASSEAS